MAVVTSSSTEVISKTNPSGAPGTVAKYIQIKSKILKDIANGHYPVGTYLPSENELCKIFNVSRVTIRMALDLLHEVNILAGHQGKGHYVCPIQANQDLGRLQGFGEIMAPLEVKTYSKVISSKYSQADTKIANILDLEKGDEVVCIERVRMAGDTPMSVDMSYFPFDVGRQLLSLNLEHTDVFEHLDKTVIGGKIGFADIEMDLVYPTSKIRQLLNLGENERVIRVERLTYNIEGRPIDYEYLYGRPETYRFKLRVPRW